VIAGLRVTFFDVIALGLLIAAGIAALAVVRPAGPIAAALTFLSGCVLLALTYHAIAKFILRADTLPRCRRGRCRAAQYILERRAKEGDYYRCACGNLYLLTPTDEFQHATADGQLQPFKRRFYKGGPWRPPVDLDRYRR
jgi:hypothetical protein